MGENNSKNKPSIVESVKNSSRANGRSNYMRDTLAMLIDYAKNVGPLYSARTDATYVYNDKTYIIGRKIEYMREKYKKGELTATEIRILEKIGMDWVGIKRIKKQQENEM